jgi:putative tricarboxylic transport membrane protein
MSVVAATVALTMCSAAAGAAQSPWKPDRPVEIIDPGSGFDRTARLLQKIWQTKRIVEQSVTVVNKPGGNGALLTNNIIGNMALSFRDTSPLVVLENEEIALGVFNESSIRTGKDFIARLQSDPSSVSIGVSGFGGGTIWLLRWRLGQPPGLTSPS